MEPNTYLDANGVMQLQPGYRAFNGYVFTDSDCKLYNLRMRDVARNANYPAGLERCIDARHRTFCLITGCNS